ncbi:hypothetical protein EZS27_023362 [termite gut metagenome]|uniref:Uncharacterized protein n=1 Tax=termite gut metagenome TaxID=433724 RepID=A0A5J4R1S4_9ZZZZ
MNGFCILSFHDSVEMFMKLCTEEKNITIDRKISFLDYFDRIPNLQCKVTMDNLNRKRMTLKHNGVLPSMLDIEISRVNVTEFFEENTPVFFNIQFSETSLVSIVKFEIVRSYLNDALKEIDNKNFADSIQYSHIIFKELFLLMKIINNDYP